MIIDKTLNELASEPRKEKVLEKPKDKHSPIRKELIDALKHLEGVKRKLKKVLDSA